MYGIEVITPPASVPVTAAELRGRLRLNDTAEDGVLTELLAAAVELFEEDTHRPVLVTAYRQHLSRWPWSVCFGPGVPPPADPVAYLPVIPGGGPAIAPGRIALARGGVTTVTAVYRRLADGSAEEVEDWTADLWCPPARVILAAVPDPVTTAAGVPISPVGYVDYTAGWSSPAAVPQMVRTALMLIAAHWYEHRESYTEKDLGELPAGWSRVVNKFKLGISGDWGQ